MTHVWVWFGVYISCAAICYHLYCIVLHVLHLKVIIYLLVQIFWKLLYILFCLSHTLFWVCSFNSVFSSQIVCGIFLARFWNKCHSGSLLQTSLVFPCLWPPLFLYSPQITIQKDKKCKKKKTQKHKRPNRKFHIVMSCDVY